MTRQQIRDYNYHVGMIIGRDHEVALSACAVWAVAFIWSMYVFALHMPYLQNHDGYTGLFAVMTLVTAILTSMAAYPFMRLGVPLFVLRYLKLPETPDTCVKCQNQIQQ